MPATTTLRRDISRTRPAWRMPAPRDVVVKGERIRYFEQGRGAPLVLLRGLSRSMSVECPAEFARLVDEFAPQ